MNSNTRATKNGPFCWQSKEVLLLLHDHFSESNNLPAAYAVYTALTMLASDFQCETFTVKKALIAYKAGLSVTSVQRVIKRMEEISLILVRRQLSASGRPEAENTYSLLAPSEKLAPLVHGELPVGHGELPVGHRGKQPSVTDKVEESQKNLREESDEEGGGAKAPVSACADIVPCEKHAMVPRKPRAVTRDTAPAFPDPPPALANLPAFPKAWEEFGRMRQKIRKPLTAYAAELLLRKLALRPEAAVAGLEMAIENTWQGLEWEWFDRRRVTETAEGKIRVHAPAPPTAAAPNPTPAEIAVWLEVFIATNPQCASKRGEWRTWNHLPPYARDRFRQYQRDPQAPQAIAA